MIDASLLEERTRQRDAAWLEIRGLLSRLDNVEGRVKRLCAVAEQFLDCLCEFGEHGYCAECADALAAEIEACAMNGIDERKPSR